jgi:hypothetical protein
MVGNDRRESQLVAPNNCSKNVLICVSRMVPSEMVIVSATAEANW